jgi:Arc/MetJ family transcription regulator
MLFPVIKDRGTHMKTTIDLADPLLAEARKLVRRDGTTVRALVEQGLRQVLVQKRRAAPFRLRDASFDGDGLRPDLRGASWDRVRELAYEGRGG